MSDKIEIKKGHDYFGRFEPLEVLVRLDGPRTLHSWIRDEILKKLSSGE